MYFYFILGYLFGTIVGIIIFSIRKPKNFGTLRVDQSDPDDKYLFLELHSPLTELKSKKQITLDVELKDFIPRN